MNEKIKKAAKNSICIFHVIGVLYGIYIGAFFNNRQTVFQDKWLLIMSLTGVIAIMFLFMNLGLNFFEWQAKDDKKDN